MREGAFAENIQPKVLCEGEEAPEGRQFAAFLKSRDSKVQGYHNEVGRDDAEKAFDIELSVGYGFVAYHPAEELSPDEVAAEYEEEVDACPSEAAYLIHMRRMSEDAIVEHEHKYDRQGTQMVQSCQAAGRRNRLHRMMLQNNDEGIALRKK